MSAKRAINDKLQGSVTTYLRCGGVNNQIKKGLLLSLRVKNFKVGKYLANFLRLLAILLAVWWPFAQSTRNNYVRAHDFQIFTDFLKNH